MARASALLALGKIGGTAHPSSRSDQARIMENLKRRTLGNMGLIALMPVAGSMSAMGIRCPERQRLCLAARSRFAKRRREGGHQVRLGLKKSTDEAASTSPPSVVSARPATAGE